MSAVKAPRPGGKDLRTQHVQVFVRVRPFNDQEVAHKAQSSVTVKGPKEVIVNDHTTPKIARTYTFDGVFGPNTQQSEIYQRVVSQSVCDVLSGFNCTIFAYGQTGSGKTYTMEGDICDGDQGAKAGLIPRAMAALFDELRLQKAEFIVRISFIELYNEELYDLFSPEEIPPKLRLFDDPTKKGSIVIQPMEEVPVHSKNQVMETLKKGLAKRQIAATQMNAHSSRSHTVFCATVHTKESNLEGEELVKFGKLYLVDLAGSENIGRSGSVDKRAREAGSINQSLLTLGRVINCLVERQPHVPYRESKLTRVLQDSLGGRTKTSIIATVSPAATNIEETLSTLDYALKAKSISNKPEVNQRVSKEAIMKEYAVLIEDLKKKLNLTREGSGIYLANENYKDFIDQLEARNQDLIEKIAQIRVCVNETKRYEKLFAELSSQLSFKEQRLDEVEHDLEVTEKRKLESQIELKTELDKLAETTELVEKADLYENQVHNQAENLISVVEECQGNSDQLHAKLDNSRAIEANNIQYAHSLVRELGRLKESVSTKVDQVLGATASLTALSLQLRTLKDDGENEVKEFKHLVHSKVAQLNSTLQKISDAFEDQMNYKKSWNAETLAEANERCEERVKFVTILQNELTESFENYKSFVKTVGEVKGPIAETVNEVQKVWLDILEKISTASGNGLKEACGKLSRQIHQGDAAFKQIESSANDFCEQEEKFTKEKSEAVEAVFAEIAKLEKLMDDHEEAGSRALARTDELVKEAASFVLTCKPILTDTVCAAKEDAERVINNNYYGAPSLTGAVVRHLEECETEVKISPTSLLHTESTCQEFCDENSSGWSSLLSHTVEALEARDQESKDTDRIKDKCLEDMRKELAELERKYAEDAKKIREKFGKFEGQCGLSLDRISDVTRNSRSDIQDQLNTQSTLVRTFIKDQFKKDCPTGQTPPRKEMQIPPLIEPLGSPDVRRIVRKVDEDWENNLHNY